jgi:hypothetical protein
MAAGHNRDPDPAIAGLRLCSRLTGATAGPDEGGPLRAGWFWYTILLSQQGGAPELGKFFEEYPRSPRAFIACGSIRPAALKINPVQLAQKSRGKSAPAKAGRSPAATMPGRDPSGSGGLLTRTSPLAGFARHPG